MARDPKLTPELLANVCKTLNAGVDIETACLREGISRRTFYNWRKWGEEGREPYAEFLEATDKALANVETHMTGVIVREAVKNWAAAAWWLKFRKTGGKHEVTVRGAVGTMQGHLSPRTAAEIRRQILYGLDADDPDDVEGGSDDSE